jgi:predicted MFS family arabinose efflux permease
VKRGTFVILCLEGAVLSFNVAASAAVIPSLAVSFRASEFYTGASVWLYMIPYGVAALFYGPLVRIYDAKKVELIFFFLFCLANLLAGFAPGIVTFFVARFFTGVFGASVIPLVVILIARSCDKERRGRLLGLFFSATFVASLIGLLASGVVGWRLLYLAPGFAGLALLVVMALWLPGFKPQPRLARVTYLTALKNKRIRLLFTYIFLVALFYHGVQQWLSVYFSQQFKLQQFFISMLITLTSLSGVFGEVIGGWCADRVGRLPTINTGIALMIASVFLVMFKMPLWVVAVLMAAWGLGWTFNHVGLSTVLTDLPGEVLNEAASLNSSVRFIAGGLGTVASGWLMQKSFTLGFSVLGICLVGLLLFSRRFIIET